MGQISATEKWVKESSALSCLDSKVVAQVQLHGEKAQQLSLGEQRGMYSTIYVPVMSRHCFCFGFRRLAGGRVEPERRLEGQQFTKLGRKYHHDWLYLQSMNSDKQLQSPFKGNLDDDILHWLLWVLSFHVVSAYGTRYSRETKNDKTKQWLEPGSGTRLF